MLDKNSPIPLVYQVESLLQKYIIAGKYAIGEQLPTQEELAQLLGVSRITVRNAFNTMINKGFLSSTRGRGTIVVAIPEDNSVEKQIEIAEKVDYFLLDSEGNVRDSENSKLSVEESCKFVFLRSIEDTPIAIERVWLAPIIEDDIQRLMKDFYPSLESLYKDKGILIEKYEETLEPRIADDFICNQLQLHNSFPLLCIKRLSYSIGREQAFEYREILMRYEDYKKVVKNPHISAN